MTAQLAPSPIFKGFDNNGFPLAFGKLFTYAAGTTTPQVTYVDSTQTTQNQNPITLNFRGECPLWLNPLLAYKFLLTDIAGNIIPGWPVDNVQGGIGVASNIVPSQTNTFTLGTPTISFANGYFGPNGAPVLDPVSGNIGYYSRTATEIAASVTPANFSYPPGSFQRYGMDGTGATDSAPGLTNALLCNDYVFDAYAGGGNYIFNSTVLPTRYPLRIAGAAKTVGGSAVGGTRFTLQSVAGSNVALLHWTAFVSDIEIEHISFGWQTVTTGQIAILFDVDCRSSRIHDNAFNGAVNAGTNVTCIKLAGGGTFSGDVTIEKNYIDEVQTGVYLGSTCSTVRVVNNELYCNATILTSFGVNNQSTVGGVVIEGNTFEQWVKGVYAPGGATRLFHNYFEGNSISDFDFGASGNNTAIADFNTGAGVANVLFNNSSKNLIWSPTYGYFADSSVLNAFRGFNEQNRAVANGHQITRTFAAGNYGGSGSQTWTVTSGEVNADMLVVNGNEATYYFEINSATVGGTPATALTINLASFGITPSVDSFNACSTTDNGGTPGIGLVRAIASSQTLLLYKDGTFASNWSAATTATTVRGHIKFPIAFVVN